MPHSQSRDRGRSQGRPPTEYFSSAQVSTGVTYVHVEGASEGYAQALYGWFCALFLSLVEMRTSSPYLRIHPWVVLYTFEGILPPSPQAKMCCFPLQPCLTPNALMVSLDKNIILQLDLFCRK
jgi:hypothetical protein